MTEKPTGLALMRAEFAPNQMSKLPKGTKAQNQCPPDQKVNCQVCGGWHHPKIRHLDYVGHAAVTDRLLDCDPAWTWEPLAFGPDGLMYGLVFTVYIAGEFKVTRGLDTLYEGPSFDAAAEAFNAAA